MSMVFGIDGFYGDRELGVEEVVDDIGVAVDRHFDVVAALVVDHVEREHGGYPEDNVGCPACLTVSMQSEDIRGALQAGGRVSTDISRDGVAGRVVTDAWQD